MGLLRPRTGDLRLPLGLLELCTDSSTFCDDERSSEGAWRAQVTNPLHLSWDRVAEVGTALNDSMIL